MSDLGRGGTAHGFSWLLAWTTVGALVPGAGLVAAGRRRLGVLVMLVPAGAAGGVLTYARSGTNRSGGYPGLAVALALDPRVLVFAAWAGGRLAVLWAALIVLTTRQLRRHAAVTSSQDVLVWGLVVVLIAGIAGPAFKISSYAMIARGVVTSTTVFGGQHERISGGPAEQAVDPWAHTPRLNVLLIGSDAGPDRIGVRPDTLILASINTRTGNTVLFSLPRSLQHAPFASGTPGHRAFPKGFYCPNVAPGSECLLNAVWMWATSGQGRQYYEGFDDPGLQATEDAVW